MCTPAPTTAPASTWERVPMTAPLWITAFGPTETPPSKDALGSTCAERWMPCCRRTGLSNTAARAKASFGWGTSSIGLLEPSLASLSEVTMAPARLACAAASAASLSAKTSCRSMAFDAAPTPSISIADASSHPAGRTSTAPRCAASSESRMSSTIERRLTGRARLPAAVDPQPLLREAPHPCLNGGGADLRVGDDVLLVVAGVDKLQGFPELKHVLLLFFAPGKEAGQHGGFRPPGHAGQTGRGAGW